MTEAFVAARLRVNWKDLVWAASNHWLDARSLADLADKLAGDDDDVRVAIADALHDDEAALEAVFDHQAPRDATSAETVRERWMHLAVAWLYQHRELFDDPWVILEEIWEAFGHAESLNGLIRWMPVPRGEQPGQEAMQDRWRAYAESH